MIDTTITVGNIIEVTTILIGGIIVFSLLRANVVTLNEQVGELKTDVRALNKIVVEAAVTHNRLENLRHDIQAIETDIRELRHGRGFITNRSRSDIEGEYP